jgi:hypothetical protein
MFKKGCLTVKKELDESEDSPGKIESRLCPSVQTETAKFIKLIQK